MKAMILENADHFGEFSGQVLPQRGRIFVTCPNCGERYALEMPPFTWDAVGRNIGPASIALNAPDCGWHGYMHGGEWKGDTPCKSPSVSKLFKKKENELEH